MFLKVYVNYVEKGANLNKKCRAKLLKLRFGWVSFSFVGLVCVFF